MSAAEGANISHFIVYRNVICDDLYSAMIFVIPSYTHISLFAIFPEIVLNITRIVESCIITAVL
jgi:hypothetical protein